MDDGIAASRATAAPGGGTRALLLLCVLGVVIAPGIVVGGGGAFALWRWRRPRAAARWGGAALAAVMAGLLLPGVVWDWPMRVFTGALLPGPALVTSIMGEALLGPLILQAALSCGDRLEADQDTRPAASGQAGGPRGDRPPVEDGPGHPAAYVPHPPGVIRLGTETNGQPFDVLLPTDLQSSVYIAGRPGKGKTTTLTRLADGALANGYAVVIIDCKGGGLREDATAMGAAYALPTTIFSIEMPDDSWGYNVCTGDGADIADKLVGAFTFEGASGVYKDVALAIVPLIVRGMQNIGEPVTIEGLGARLAHGRIKDLAVRVTDESLGKRLRALEDAPDPTKSGRDGFAIRLQALQAGKFGDLLSRTPAIDWTTTLAAPSVTYIEISTMANSESVNLLARVLIQDLKQVAQRRIAALTTAKKRGDTPTIVPVLLIIDEFAALKEPAQITDLLLQGRQAQMPVVISTQVLPEDATLRRATMGNVGLLIVHSVSAEDATLLANQYGTHPVTKTGVTVRDQEDEPLSVTIQDGVAYNVHPNTLLTLGTGEVYVLPMNRTPVMAPRRVGVCRESLPPGNTA